MVGVLASPATAVAGARRAQQLLRTLGPGTGGGPGRPSRGLAGRAPSPRDVCIVGMARTPMGAFQGALSQLTAPQLGSVAIRAALERAGVGPELVQEVIMGNVLSAGLGQAPARQAALGAGLPPSACCTTVNKVCSSGMKAVTMAQQSIAAGVNDVVVAGGMESMSNCPYYLPKARAGHRMGHAQAVDGMLFDGLWDPYGDEHMGNCGELCAAEFGISREAQDDFALESCRRAHRGAAEGWFREEIAPVEVPGRGGRPGTLVEADEAVQDVQEAKLRGLRPAFQRDGGTVTAGNASPISDGASALVLVSRAKAEALGLAVLATVEGWAEAEQRPEWFTTSPALAMPKAIARAGLTVEDVEYFEINEAFAVVGLVNRQKLGLPAARVNAHGGAVALGHPVGSSGARIIITLASVLKRHGGRVGCAGICNGGGGASAIVIRREAA